MSLVVALVAIAHLCRLVLERGSLLPFTTPYSLSLMTLPSVRFFSWSEHGLSSISQAPTESVPAAVQTKVFVAEVVLRIACDYHREVGRCALTPKRAFTIRT